MFYARIYEVAKSEELNAIVRVLSTSPVSDEEAEHVALLADRLITTLEDARAHNLENCNVPTE
jgi:hypothetical protein